MVANEAFSFEKYDEYTRINQVLEGSVIDFIEHAIEERKDIRESTRKVHMCLVQALREFKKIQYFSDVTVANIMAFDNWLHARKNYRVVSIFSYHRRFHTYINLAIKLEYLNKDPYFTFRPDKGEKEVIRYIEEADILKLKKLKLDLKYLERTRDLFIFQCYTGLSYSDLALFDYSKVEIEKNSKGKKVYVLRDKRLKTNTNFTIVLMKPAMEILTKYDYKLPIISNQKYNKYLKEIGKMAKFPIELTTHVARHTFATFCINNKVNIEIVSKAMGHSNIATTQIYAKILDKTVQNELSNLDAKLKKSK